MKITKNHFKSLVVLLVIFLAQVILITNMPAVQASMWDTARDGGLDKVGEAYGETGDPTDVRVIAASVVKAFIGFLGIILVILIVMAGYKYMTSQGNEEKITEALAQIKAGIIGLIIILSAYAITYFVAEYALKAVSDST